MAQKTKTLRETLGAMRHIHPRQSRLIGDKNGDYERIVNGVSLLRRILPGSKLPEGYQFVDVFHDQAVYSENSLRQIFWSVKLYW